ncbi:MAG: hypothetical protein HC819_03810 [Cyclobacteriaceae bacterium]|nr:hypothetical protein [Cyclobacteriaceae bacterium]
MAKFTFLFVIMLTSMAGSAQTYQIDSLFDASRAQFELGETALAKKYLNRP